MTLPEFLASVKPTQTWEKHPGLGGVDWPMTEGTPLPAPADGLLTITHTHGGAGDIATIRFSNRCATVYEHIQRQPEVKDVPVAANETVALSDGRKGVDGAGASTGAHVHVHDLDAAGTRQRPFTLAPITRKKKRMDQYALVKSTTNDTVWMTRASDGAFRPLKGAEGLAFMKQLDVAVVPADVLSASVNAAPKWDRD